MINKQEKGFAIVLALVLLMAMTLMGGALIVISASDHRSNNISDEYQQAFYVAETALYEGEKYVMDQYKGPYKKTDLSRDPTKSGLPINNTVKFEPKETDDIYECFHSFADIKTDNFFVLKWNKPDQWAGDLKGEAGYENIFNTLNYYDFIAPNNSKVIVENPISNNADIEKNVKSKLIAREVKRLKKFKYHYFITRVGSAPFKGYGSSIKKGASDSGNDGVAYRIYGCGEYDPDIGETFSSNAGKIMVPLESTLILPK